MKKFKLTTKIKRKLDKIFSAYIHKRDGETCIWCQRKGIRMNTSHILPKEFEISRWDPNNAILLCARCHRLGRTSFHQSPLHFYEFYVNHYGQEMVDYLLNLSKSSSVNWNEETINRIINDLTTGNFKYQTVKA
jgi:hypothetical protein